MMKVAALLALAPLLFCEARGALSPLLFYHPNRALAIRWLIQLNFIQNGAKEVDFGPFIDIQSYFIEDATKLNSSCPDCSKCTQSLISFGNDILHKKQYTFQVLDSNGKPESGLLIGNVKWSGRYHECQTVRDHAFQGKWCALEIGPQVFIYGNASLGFFIGVCLPDTCSVDHLSERLQPLVKKTGVDASINCPVQPTKWTSGDITSMVIFSLLLVFVAVGSFTELMRRCKVKSEALAVSGDGIIAEYRKEHISVFFKIADAFSVFKNTGDLVNTSGQEGMIDSIHGIRFFSIAWVIIGHVFVMPGLYLDNFVDLAHWYLDNFEFQMIANATLAVDTFFCIGALLVTYLTLREAARNSGKINVLKMYFHRYLRLTPSYAMVILIIVGFFTKFGEGPMWPETVNSQKQICDRYWWTNLLYINNLYPTNLIDECFVVSWYLANDMQFFILAPIFIILLHRKPKIGIAALIVGIIANLFVVGFVSSNSKEQPPVVGLAQVMQFIVNPVNTSIPSPSGTLSPNITDQVRDYWNDTYAKPWCRIGSYFVGMLAGYILHSTSCKLKMNKVVVVIGWICALAANFILVFGLWSHVHHVTPLTVSSAAFFNAVARPLWAATVAWVIVACACGYGGPMNSILSCKFFVPLSRLTYCTYLVHTLIITWWFAPREVDAFLTKKDFIFHYISISVVSFAGAYVLSMTVEAPFIGLAKTFLRKKRDLVNVDDEEPLMQSSDVGAMSDNNMTFGDSEE